MRTRFTPRAAIRRARRSLRSWPRSAPPARRSASSALRFNAGHALNYFNVQPVAALPGVRELHIGHAIVSRAVFVGLREAVRQMKALLREAASPADAPSGQRTMNAIAFRAGRWSWGSRDIELTAADRERLAHPLVGAVILFARNFVDGRQLAALTAQIHALRSPPLLIARRSRRRSRAAVPRRLYADPGDAHAGRAMGWRDVALAASEADAPGRSHRARAARPWRRFQLHAGARSRFRVEHGDRRPRASTAMRTPPRISHRALRRGLNAGGCAAVGKHFPGHGFVAADSHFERPGRRAAARRARRQRPDSVRGVGTRRPRGDHAGARHLSGRGCAAGRLLANLAAGHPARAARFRRTRVFRRSRHGRRAYRWRSRRAARTRRAAPVATWCSPATTSRPPTNCCRGGGLPHAAAARGTVSADARQVGGGLCASGIDRASAMSESNEPSPELDACTLPRGGVAGTRRPRGLLSSRRAVRQVRHEGQSPFLGSACRASTVPSSMRTACCTRRLPRRAASVRSSLRSIGRDRTKAVQRCYVSTDDSSSTRTLRRQKFASLVPWHINGHNGRGEAH